MEEKNQFHKREGKGGVQGKALIGRIAEERNPAKASRSSHWEKGNQLRGALKHANLQADQRTCSGTEKTSNPKGASVRDPSSQKAVASEFL